MIFSFLFKGKAQKCECVFAIKAITVYYTYYYIFSHVFERLFIGRKVNKR